MTVRWGRRRARLAIVAGCAAALTVILSCSPSLPGEAAPQSPSAAADQIASETTPTSGVLPKADYHDGRSRYGELNIPTGTKQLLVNGRPVLTTDESGLSLHSAYALGDTDAFVVFVNSGGTACPGQFRVVSIGPDGSTHTSELFGSCSDILQGKVAGGQLLLRTHNFSNVETPKGWEHYTFSNRQLTPRFINARRAYSRHGRLETTTDQKTLLFNGRRLIDAATLPTAPKTVRLEILDDVSSLDASDVFHIRAQTGDKDCPAFSVLVSLHPDRDPQLSRPFGACDHDHAYLTATSGRLRVNAFGRRDAIGPDIYEYQDGRITGGP